MQLEKILEEIDAHAIEFEIFGTSDDYISVGWVKDIIRKHLSRENAAEIKRSSRDNDGWIPVERGLPEEYGEYLATIGPSYLWAKRIIANFSDLMGIVKKPIFYTGKVGKIDFEDITDMVIAWRPLPEPYRPERSDNHDGE